MEKLNYDKSSVVWHFKSFRGTRQEIGHGLGCFYAEHGLACYRLGDDPRDRNPKQLSYAVSQIEIAEAYAPGIVEELRALAEELGLDFEQAAAMALTSGMYRRNMGCTAFVVRDRRGHVWLARNMDFNLPRGHATFLARFTSPTDAYATFGGTEALLGYTEGINEHGVAIAMALVPCMEYDWETSLPKEPPEKGLLFSIAIRIALETCRCASSAADFLSSIPHLEAFNYLIADPSGRVFVVEASPWGCYTLKATVEDKVIITNVFSRLSLDKQGMWTEEEFRSQKTLSGLRERAIRTAWELIDCSQQGLDETTIFSLLSMVAFDFEAGDATHTIGSASFNTNEAAIWWCEGSPRRHRFEPIGTVGHPNLGNAFSTKLREDPKNQPVSKGE